MTPPFIIILEYAGLSVHFFTVITLRSDFGSLFVRIVKVWLFTQFPSSSRISMTMSFAFSAYIPKIGTRCSFFLGSSVTKSVSFKFPFVVTRTRAGSSKMNKASAVNGASPYGSFITSIWSNVYSPLLKSCLYK